MKIAFLAAAKKALGPGCLTSGCSPSTLLKLRVELGAEGAVQQFRDELCQEKGQLSQLMWGKGGFIGQETVLQFLSRYNTPDSVSFEANDTKAAGNHNNAYSVQGQIERWWQSTKFQVCQYVP